MNMQVNIYELKTLIEAGDKSAIEQHILKSLEKGDIVSAAAVNTQVKSELDSEKGKHESVALQTWKENNLQTLIDEAVKASNPSETPEQKEIRELKERIEKSEKDAARSALKAKALEHATKEGLPSAFATKHIERFLGDDETITTSTLNELKSDLDALVQAGVEEKLKGSKRDPRSGGGDGADELSYGKKLADQSNSTKKAEETQKAFFG